MRLLASVLGAAAALALLAGTARAEPIHSATLHVGQLFTVTGYTGVPRGKDTNAVGPVIVRGRWDHGAYRILVRTRTDAAGRYRFKLRPDRSGTLTLRIRPPDKLVQLYVLHVR